MVRHRWLVGWSRRYSSKRIMLPVDQVPLSILPVFSIISRISRDIGITPFTPYSSRNKDEIPRGMEVHLYPVQFRRREFHGTKRITLYRSRQMVAAHTSWAFIQMTQQAQSSTNILPKLTLNAAVVAVTRPLDLGSSNHRSTGTSLNPLATLRQVGCSGSSSFARAMAAGKASKSSASLRDCDERNTNCSTNYSLASVSYHCYRER